MTHDNAAWDFMCDQVIALKTALAAEKAALTAAEKELEHAKLWGFPSHYNWYEDLIEWLGDWHDEELCDGPWDLIAEVKEKFAAAEKVCEAAERIRRRACYVIPDRMALTAAQWKAMECGECAACQFNNALAEWRRTKEGA